MGKSALTKRELQYWADRFHLDVDDLENFLEFDPDYIRNRTVRDREQAVEREKNEKLFRELEDRVKVRMNLDQLNLDDFASGDAELTSDLIVALKLEADELVQSQSADSSYLLANILEILRVPHARGIVNKLCFEVIDNYEGITAGIAADCLAVAAEPKDEEKLVRYWNGEFRSDILAGIGLAIARVNPLRASELAIDALRLKRRRFEWMSIEILNNLRVKIPQDLYQEIYENADGELRVLLRRNLKF